MITRLEALNFRCFRHLSLPLERFQVLTGPAGSGKSACLDILLFIHDLVTEDLESALHRRAGDWGDLLDSRQSPRFELAVEASIPQELRQQTSFPDYPVVRYEVAVGAGDAGRGPAILEEKVLLEEREPETGQRDLFPVPVKEPETILRSSRLRSNRTVMAKVPHGNDNFYAEVDRPEGKFWTPSFKLGPRRSVLGHMPEDPARFPVAAWLRDLMTRSLLRVDLDCAAMARSSAPGFGTRLRLDGANLPWTVDDLRRRQPQRFQNWLNQLRAVYPEIADVGAEERLSDRHCHLTVRFADGQVMAAWQLGGGLLRLLALTLLAQEGDGPAVVLLDGAVCGLAPRVEAAVVGLLADCPLGQVLLTSHSPAVLAAVDAAAVIACVRAPDGSLRLVRGTDHPDLAAWQAEARAFDFSARGLLE
jgi:predicted ATPase